MQPYTLKYQPKATDHVIGQDMALAFLKDYVPHYKKQKKRGALLYGPTGVGKTSSVYALARELNLEILEVNASDTRNANEINEVIGSASKQMSLFAKGKLILIDEIDGLAGNKDRGGLQAILKIMEKSSFPIVLTAQNPWGDKFNALRRKTEMIEFQPLEASAIFTILKNICEKEKIIHEDLIIKSIAHRSGNDARAAINDLQTLAFATKKLTKDGLEELGERNRTDSIIAALFKVFKSTDPAVAVGAFDTVKEDLDHQLLWIDENLPKEYTKPEDLVKAYDALSKALVFKGRIRRWQHYRFYVYIYVLLTVGIAVAKKERYKKQVEYKPTGRLLKLWWAKQKSFKKKAIAERIAIKTHTSTKRVLQDVLPYVQVSFKKDRNFQNKLIEELELSREEIAWLKK